MRERSGVVVPGTLTFTVGLPQSGKSTWANNWVRGPFKAGSLAWPDNVSFNYLNDEITVSRPRVIVAGDDFRHAIHGREYLVEAEGLVFASMDIAARALLSRGFDVLIDETCTTQSTLLRMLKLDLQARPIFIDTTLDVCRQRALDSGRPYLLGPMERMALQVLDLKFNWEAIVTKLTGYLKLRQGNDVAV